MGAIVVVSGLPARARHAHEDAGAGGLPLVTDGIRAADEDNPKGYYEVERVKNLAGETDKVTCGRARQGLKVISYLLRSLPRDLNYRVVFVRRTWRRSWRRNARCSSAAERATRSHREDARALPGRPVASTWLLKHSAQFESIE